MHEVKRAGRYFFPVSLSCVHRAAAVVVVASRHTADDTLSLPLSLSLAPESSMRRRCRRRRLVCSLHCTHGRACSGGEGRQKKGLTLEARARLHLPLDLAAGARTWCVVRRQWMSMTRMTWRALAPETVCCCHHAVVTAVARLPWKIDSQPALFSRSLSFFSSRLYLLSCGAR